MTERRTSDSELRGFAEQGFAVLPGVLAGRDLRALTDECIAAWRRHKGNHDPAGTWLHNALLADVHRDSERVRRYYFAGPLVDVAEQLIGPNVKGATSQLTFKLRGNDQAVGWHQDNGYGHLEPQTAVSALTALDDTDEHNDCLWVLPGSHRRGQIDISDRFDAHRKAAGAELTVDVDNPEDAVPVPLRAGDALVFHCHLLHRSEGNRSSTRDRRILFLRYADADAVEVYNDRRPRLGPLLRGETRFPEVAAFERELVAACR